MKKRICALFLILAVGFASLSALAEPMPYMLGDITLPIPAEYYVFTRENHKVDGNIAQSVFSQDDMDAMYDATPFLQMNLLSPDFTHEIAVYQTVNDMLADFSEAGESSLLLLKPALEKQLAESFGIVLDGEMQIIKHPQTYFYFLVDRQKLKGKRYI